MDFCRYFLEISYLGTAYAGWQYQPNAVSIQEKLEEALSKILGKKTSVIAAGRTDAGVHALRMFVHFDYEKKIDCKIFIYKINAILPNDIVLNHIFQVHENVHARFHAISRTYQYHIYLGRNPFLLQTTWQIYKQKLCIKKMNSASELLLKFENFKSFSRSKTQVKTYLCEMKNAFWKRENNLLIFEITANRFLRNMVRAIVGTLVEIGKEKLSLSDFQKIIESKCRSHAGISAPARGLFLTKIAYPETIKK